MTPETSELVGVLVSLLPWVVFAGAVIGFALVEPLTIIRDRVASRRLRRRRIRRHAPA